MHSDRLYAFFVTDDRARWRAFVWSSALAIILGLLLLVSGAKEEIAAVLTAFSSMVIMTIFASRYVRRSVPIRAVAVRSRRWLFTKLAIVVGADWLMDAVLSNVSWAIAFAANAEAAIASNREVSVVKVALAKQTIATALRSSVQDPKRLTTAYCQVTAAQLYDEARRGAKVFLESESLDELRIPRHAVILKGNGGYAIFRMPTAGVHIRLGHQFMIFEQIIFEGPSPPLRAELLMVERPSKILVKDCIVRNYHQDLDRITWVEVIFEACEIKSTLENTLLLNVTFQDCSLDIPAASGFPLRASERVNASGVSYSSEAQQLLSKQMRSRAEMPGSRQKTDSSA